MLFETYKTKQKLILITRKTGFIEMHVRPMEHTGEYFKNFGIDLLDRCCPFCHFQLTMREV